MGSSYVEYHGHGFWSWDGYLEDVLAYLANQIVPSADEEWLSSLRDHWRLQSTGIFGGWIHPRLSEVLTTDERRDRILGLLAHGMRQNDLTREARETMLFFAALLRGEIDTDEASPLDYMVHGERPYEPSEGSGLKTRFDSVWSKFVIHRRIVLTERNRLTERTQHTHEQITKAVQGGDLLPPNSLAIAQLPPNEGFYLLSRDGAGDEIAITYHESEEKAMKQAAWEFNVEPADWKIPA
jgi:hypothetical protein